MLYIIASSHEISSSYLNFPIFYWFFSNFWHFEFFFFFKIHYFFQAKLLVPEAKNFGNKLFASRGLSIKKFIQIWNLGWHFWLFLDAFKKYSPLSFLYIKILFPLSEFIFSLYSFSFSYFLILFHLHILFRLL
jgi:hypothetical protein